MNGTKPIPDPADPQPWIPAVSTKQQSTSSSTGPYDKNLLGEYTRLLLLLVSIPLLAWFASQNATLQSGFLSLIAGFALLASLFSNRGTSLLRICLLGFMAINVLAVVANAGVLDRKANDWDIPNLLLLGCLVIAIVFETGSTTPDFSYKSILRLAAWTLVAVPAIIYIVVIPVIELAWLNIEGDEKKLALQDPDWNLLNESLFRSAEFLIFSLFTYLGACAGSFLNVVAYSVPRGEPIGLRDSSCPQCNSKISRIDNLPIFSYLNLGAQCRNCQAHIPVRYLVVELVIALIFGSLFLFELVTGCQNIPSMRITHKGILWVILYPKWPAIAIYFYHAIFMSCLLVLAIFEWDRQPLKSVFAGFIGSIFFAAALIYWPIHPVAASHHLALPALAEQAIKPLAGALAGAVIGLCLRAAPANFQSKSFHFALILTGITLGWQALIQIAVLYVMAWAISRWIPALKSVVDQSPTALLLTTVLIHHPFWNAIASCWI